MVVSWICVLCIFIIVANLLRWMYIIVFRETVPVRENRTLKNREFQKVYVQPAYQYQQRSTDTEGRVSYQESSHRYVAPYSSYENYQRSKRKIG